MSVNKIACVIALLLLTVSGVCARDLVIAGIPEKPLRWAAADGSVVGFDVDVIDHIMKTLKVPYKVVLVESSTRLERNARATPSEYDMVFTFSHTDERMTYLRYPTESHISFKWNFFLRKEDQGKFVFNTYADLAQLTIGVTRGMAYSDEFLKAVKEIPLHVDEVSTNKLQMDKLLAHRFDLVPLNTHATLYEAGERGYMDRIAYLPKPIKERAYFNTFVVGSTYPQLPELMTQYDQTLRQMRHDGTLVRLMAPYGLAPTKVK